MAIYPPKDRNTDDDKFAHIVRNNETDIEETVRDVPVCDKMRTNKEDDEEDEDDESNEKAEGNEEENIDSVRKEFDDTSRCYDEIEQYKCEIKESVKTLLDKLSRQRKERERLGYPPLPQAPSPEQQNAPPDPPPPPSHNPLPPCSMASSIPCSSKNSPDTANTGLDKKLPLNNSAPKLTFAPGSPVSGVGPCWPPSTSHVIDNIRGSQLLERRELSQFPEAYLSTLEPRSADEKGTFIRNTVKPLHRKPAPQPVQPELYSDYCYLPTVPRKEGLTCISPEFLNNFGTAVPVYQQTSNSKEGAAMLRRPNGDILYLPPVPLSDCLSPSGSKIPHKLGLRFKTEAHRR